VKYIGWIFAVVIAGALGVVLLRRREQPPAVAAAMGTHTSTSPLPPPAPALDPTAQRIAAIGGTIQGLTGQLPGLLKGLGI
jgi:hypothetical protein